MAEKSVLDTTILIDAIDHGRHAELLSADASISIISVYEFIRHKKRMLENKLLLEDSFDVIGINNPLILKAAEIYVKLAENGTIVNENDIYIASAAMINGMPLYTKDKDFLSIKKYFKDFKVQYVRE